MFKKIQNNKNGTILIAALTISTVLLTLASGLVTLSIYEKKLYLRQTAAVQSLHIAEAGINYYRWHLAHEPDDFFDGTGSDPDAILPNGPYEHTYTATGLSGKFSLEITPPVTGSTILTIKSTGWSDDFPTLKKTISIQYGIPSLAQYAFLTNSETWFGDTETVSGPMHSNGGIRMDGSNDSIISSAKTTYTCPSSQSCNTIGTCLSPCTWSALTSLCTCPGIWGIGAGNALWDYPSITIDFAGITADMAEMKLNAIADGFYLDHIGGSRGIHIVLKNDATFDVYNITRLQGTVSQKNDDWTDWRNPQGYENLAEEIRDQTLINNYPIPDNGLIFIEDDVWVDGVVNGRITLVAANLTTSTQRNIFINNNINYLARDGSHVLGLMAQKDIRVPRYAPTNLTIDAFLLAQNGRVFRNLYNSKVVKNSIEIYGGIITNKTWTWSWVNGSGTVTDGYTNTNSIFDADAKFNPPPDFPTTGEYAVISWEEIPQN